MVEQKAKLKKKKKDLGRGCKFRVQAHMKHPRAMTVRLGLEECKETWKSKPFQKSFVYLKKHFAGI